ncbi:type II toxin-antitoxin system MqsA family antitoxin [Agrobacterium sp. SHOUNA12C]|uniref:helix-turn-helix domain-containing protein n=1 Tax=Rhizobium TaxID=379 RepID=UPI00026EE05E|nr:MULTISPECIES: type II toxin-antitoxin system MqsA family antitoxin [Rhizobium]MCJ9721137.1 type II toxin-antitoxin system MqsA family antitoxin [Agrobacterium sp. BETTINA12B]MCJ9755894.1 type II toxin-antitoxin system MqsA family antitoxin [Agrobacterium sp. SHOUNA12C]EJK82895.1 putative transcriptional regulator [Rhizobium sp. AP16]NTI21006.1 type II toxin-antitoxin system MqsA family antitoxin [Rhizobium rhizogenes]QTG04645.1 type II toxin-antitoxin system MqsA family antitoxin [Rhizobium
MTNKTTIWRHHGETNKDIIKYIGCGLDDIYLASGYEVHKTPYGEGVSIRNLDKLHKQIGLHLTKFRKALSGKEIRFLRHQMDLTQSELARFFGCNVQQVARYEKGENRLTGPADRLLRLLYEEHIRKTGSVRELLESIDSMDDASDEQIIFEDVNGEWRHAC